MMFSRISAVIALVAVTTSNAFTVGPSQYAASTTRMSMSSTDAVAAPATEIRYVGFFLSKEKAGGSCRSWGYIVGGAACVAWLEAGLVLVTVLVTFSVCSCFYFLNFFLASFLTLPSSPHATAPTHHSQKHCCHCSRRSRKDDASRCADSSIGSLSWWHSGLGGWWTCHGQWGSRTRTWYYHPS